jgi:A/G-specific adenine glycosylase
LPWQQNITPYRIWVSEIMLQQTQVTTAIPYFNQFIKDFPNNQKLAKAPIDQVLHRWSGLGYYARARNLHKSAQIIESRWKGTLPTDLDALVSLPGIGRSTASAILAISSNQAHAILDGNVKRVLTRYHGIREWPGKTDTTKKLWQYAEHHTPNTRIADYTQAIMDLGATCCTRSSPKCSDCPLKTYCYSNINHCQAEIPAKKPKKEIPTRKTIFLILKNSKNNILLIQNPPTGIWGGLWCFPQCLLLKDIKEYCKNTLSLIVKNEKKLAKIRHTFSHFHLEIQPIQLHITEHSNQIKETTTQLWYDQERPAQVGLASPVKHLLQNLKESP